MKKLVSAAIATGLFFIAMLATAQNKVVVIPLNSCDEIVHCDGNPRGGLIFDACGVCGGDGSSCITDCNGDANGTAYLDTCGFCVGGNTGKTSQVTCVTSAGQIWMDRNLGASQVALNMTDPNAYGDLYQWGRLADGHEKRTSSTTVTLSSTDVPGHGSFIIVNTPPNDWRTPQNDNLWQGVSGINNPCPSGFRLPTTTELETERLSWSSLDGAGAFASPLKLIKAGYRYHGNGVVSNEGYYGYYWSSSPGTYLSIAIGSLTRIQSDYRALGFGIRCIKD